MNKTGYESLAERISSEALSPRDICSITIEPLSKIRVFERQSFENKYIWKRFFDCTVIQNFTHHILVKVHHGAGCFTRSINKIDIADGTCKIKYL